MIESNAGKSPKKMKRKLPPVAATAALLALATTSGCFRNPETSQAGRDYVPEAGWRDPTWSPAFYEKWFGDQLRAMNEPPMKLASDLAGNQERFRLLILPTFQPATAYRVDLGRDGSAVVGWAELDGAGGYAPGELACNGTFKFSEAQKYAFLSQIRAVNFAKLDQEKPNFCFDGTTFVFEHLDANGQKMIVRNCSAPEAPLRRLADFMPTVKPRWSLQDLICHFR